MAGGGAPRGSRGSVTDRLGCSPHHGGRDWPLVCKPLLKGAQSLVILGFQPLGVGVPGPGSSLERPGFSMLGFSGVKAKGIKTPRSPKATRP